MREYRDEQIQKALGSGYRVVGTIPGSAPSARDSASATRRAIVSSQSPGLESLKAAIAAGERSAPPSSESHRSLAPKAIAADASETSRSKGSALTCVLVETTADHKDWRSSPVRHKALVLGNEVIGVSDKMSRDAD